jgi:hypothetical protein
MLHFYYWLFLRKQGPKMIAKAIALAFVLIIVGLLLTSCVPGSGEGTVVNKYHEPARSYIYYLPMKIGNSTFMQPYMMHDDEDWILELRTPEEKIIRAYVDPKAYEHAELGDYIVFDGSWLVDKDERGEKVQ